jgi:branched-chain amino acid transport system substrate-binding protein
MRALAIHKEEVTMRSTTVRHLVGGIAALACALAVVAGTASAAPSGPPIRIGSTLALTGPLASTALVHQLVGDIYVEQINKKNGLLGRPVEWIVKDDQSKPDLARTLYEQLITVDKVDLLMGPYATGAILSAMGVAQRYNKVLVHHTFGIPSLAKYDAQFPTWSLGADPAATFPNTLFDALATTPKPPKTVAIVTSKFPSVHFMSLGAREAVKKRGLQEVVFLEWDFGNRDFGAIAARVKDANPDLVWVGAIGLEGNQLLDAMKKIDYTPPLHFYMYPAPGPMAQAPEAKNALAATIFEEHAPYLNNPGAAEFVKLFNERAAKAGLPYTAVETQAAASYSAWQVLDAAVTATKSLDDKVLAEWLRKNKVDTIQGKLRFDGPSNYGDDLMAVKQVQNGRWVTVWPKSVAAPGATLMTK